MLNSCSRDCSINSHIKGEKTAKSEWEKATPEIILKIADEIILNDQKPNAFAIHCF